MFLRRAVTASAPSHFSTFELISWKSWPTSAASSSGVSRPSKLSSVAKYNKTRNDGYGEGFPITRNYGKSAHEITYDSHGI